MTMINLKQIRNPLGGGDSSLKIDTVPEAGSVNLVTSDAVRRYTRVFEASALDGKILYYRQGRFVLCYISYNVINGMTLTSYKEVTIATIPTGYRPVHRVNVPAVLGGIKGEFPTLFVAEGDKLMATLHGGEKSIVASDQLPTMTYWNTWESFPE